MRQRNYRLSRQLERQSSAGRHGDVNLCASRSFVGARQLSQQLWFNGVGPAHEHCFRFIKRHHRLTDIPLRIRAEVDCPLAILLIVGSVEAVVVEARQWKSDFD